MILNKERNTVSICLGDIELKGILNIPKKPKGIVLFSHGSGSSRLSPRNQFVAGQLNQHHFATLLFDLLTREEDLVYENRFDIELLTRRLVEVTRWVKNHKETEGLPIGYFGASTGAASALKAAAELGDSIAAVVSRGGRPDLAGKKELQRVKVPTLLIVGEWDDVVITLNSEAYEKLSGEKSMVIVSGATHLFEEEGALEKVTEVSARWFETHLKQKE